MARAGNAAIGALHLLCGKAIVVQLLDNGRGTVAVELGMGQAAGCVWLGAFAGKEAEGSCGHLGRCHGKNQENTSYHMRRCIKQSLLLEV